MIIIRFVMEYIFIYYIYLKVINIYIIFFKILARITKPTVARREYGLEQQSSLSTCVRDNFVAVKFFF
jgi:hypothetical protein